MQSDSRVIAAVELAVAATSQANVLIDCWDRSTRDPLGGCGISARNLHLWLHGVRTPPPPWCCTSGPGHTQPTSGEFLDYYLQMGPVLLPAKSNRMDDTNFIVSSARAAAKSSDVTKK